MFDRFKGDANSAAESLLQGPGALAQLAAAAARHTPLREYEVTAVARDEGADEGAERAASRGVESKNNAKGVVVTLKTMRVSPLASFRAALKVGQEVVCSYWADEPESEGGDPSSPLAVGWFLFLPLYYIQFGANPAHNLTDSP